MINLQVHRDKDMDMGMDNVVADDDLLTPLRIEQVLQVKCN